MRLRSASKVFHFKFRYFRRSSRIIKLLLITLNNTRLYTFMLHSKGHLLLVLNGRVVLSLTLYS